MSFKKYIIISIIVLISVNTVFSQRINSKFWIYIKSGYSFKISPERFKSWYDNNKESRHAGFGLEFKLSKKLSVQSEFLKIFFASNPTVNPVTKGFTIFDMAGLLWSNEMKYSFIDKKIKPYVSLGGGFVFEVFSYFGRGRPYSRLLLSGSAGIDFLMSKRFYIFVEARYHIILHKYFGAKNTAFAPVSLGISYNL